MVFLPCPGQDCLCRTSTWLGDFGEGGGIRRWGGQQEIPFLFFSLVFPLRCLTFTLARAGKNIANFTSATSTSPAARCVSPFAPLPAQREGSGKPRQGDEVIPTLSPFPEGGSAWRPLKRGRLKREFTTLGKPFLLCNPPPSPPHQMLGFEPKSIRSRICLKCLKS